MPEELNPIGMAYLKNWNNIYKHFDIGQNMVFL